MVTNVRNEPRNVGRKKSANPTKTTRLFVKTVDELDEVADAFGMNVAEFAETILRPALDEKLVDARKILALRRKVMSGGKPSES